MIEKYRYISKIPITDTNISLYWLNPNFIVKTQNKLIKTLEVEYKSQYGNGFVIPDQVDNGNGQDFTFVMTGFIDDIILYMI